MPDNPNLIDEKDIPNWEPIDVPAMIPGRAPLGAPAPPVPHDMPQFFSGSIAPVLQHDGHFVATEMASPRIPKTALMPLGNQANPSTNAAAQSTSKIVAQQVVAANPPTAGGVTSVALTMPGIFVAPVAGSPVTSVGTFAVALAPEPANFVFAGPIDGQGTVALDTARGQTFGLINTPGQTITVNPSTVATQAGDFALLSINTENNLGATFTQPDASWTTLFAVAGAGPAGLYWKNVAVAGTVGTTVTATGSRSVSTGIATIRTSGGTPTVRGSSSSDTNSNGGIVPTSISRSVLQGSTIFFIWSGSTINGNTGNFEGPVIGLSATDNQGNSYTKICESYVAGIPHVAGGVQTAIFAATASAAGTTTITWGSATPQSFVTGEITIQFVEVTNLAPPNFIPIFRALVPSDIPALDASIITSGLLALARGGTNADLSATGGTNQVLQQSSAGAAITVGQLANSNLLGYKATSQRNESAADTNVLTFTPPATAGSYRLRFVMSVSAATAATLGWTATWRDSNGNVQTPVNLALFQSGVAAPALTFTTSTAGDYYGQIDIDINNAATNIIFQLTFTGTSFAAKVSATIERLI